MKRQKNEILQNRTGTKIQVDTMYNHLENVRATSNDDVEAAHEKRPFLR